MNTDIYKNQITIHSLNIDWNLLAKQKKLVLDFLNSESPTDFADVWNNSDGQDLMDGLLNVLDSLQDQAAEELGEEAVFGPWWSYRTPTHKIVWSEGHGFVEDEQFFTNIMDAKNYKAEHPLGKFASVVPIPDGSGLI